MNHDIPAYGLWGLVLLNSAIFIMFAFSFFKPQTKRDWRTFSSFSAFIVALFVEMYGFPLTIYVLSGWIQSRFPGVDLLSHDAGHLWYSLFGFEGTPHLNPIHILSNVLIFGGFILLSSSWRVLYKAQRDGSLAVDGPYAHLRHPQYVAFAVIMLGFLLQWPTILTLAMFPVLNFLYYRLALNEEREQQEHFGSAWASYSTQTPRFIPSLRRRRLVAEQRDSPQANRQRREEGGDMNNDDALPVRRHRYMWPLLASVALATTPAAAQDPPEHDHIPTLTADIRVLEEVFPVMALCHWATNPDATAFVYADWQGLIHHIVTVNGGLKENWQSFPLESAVRELKTADLDRDGHQEIIAWTEDSRIYIWTTLGYELRWDSTHEELGTIRALAVANVDADPQLELVLCSDNRIAVYDGVELFLERVGRDEINPLDIAIADVDADDALEIITSDGHIIDSTTLIIEWSTEPFGYPLVLFDIDANGRPEVVSRARGGIRFWDIEERRELW